MKAALIAALCALLLAGCTVGGSTTTKTVTVTPGASAAATSTTESDLPPLIPADFTIDVIVTEAKCFGTAGCSYKYTIKANYVATAPRDLRASTVIFNVTGGDQDQVGNLRVDKDGTYHYDRETSIDGPEGAKFVATVTEVLPN